MVDAGTARDVLALAKRWISTDGYVYDTTLVVALANTGHSPRKLSEADARAYAMDLQSSGVLAEVRGLMVGGQELRGRLVIGEGRTR